MNRNIKVAGKETYTKLVHKPDTGEWVVKVYVNGKYDEDKSYYTDDKQDANVEQTQDAHADEHAHAFHVLGGARHDLPRLGLVVVGKAQALQVVVDPVSDVVRDPLRHPLRPVGLAVGEDAPAGRHADEREARHDQRPPFSRGNAVFDGEACVDRPADQQRHQEDEGDGAGYACPGDDDLAPVRDDEREEADDDR